MKRILPILLVLAMLLSFAVTAHAEAAQTDAATLTAPTLCSVQTAENATDTTHDVRFLATVSDLRGTALGMEIRATFVADGETKSVLYNADDGLEGNTVYSSVKSTVDGVTTSKTAAELAGDENAKGIFAAIIKGVPSNLTVTFSVTVYVKDGETVVSSPVTMAVDQNGVFAETTTIEATDVTKTFDSAKVTDHWKVSVEDGKLVVPKHAWHANPDYYLTLADANMLKAAKTYLVEMDLTFTELATFCLILNGDKELTTDVTKQGDIRSNAMGVALRQDKIVGDDGKLTNFGSGKIQRNIVTNYITWDETGDSKKQSGVKERLPYLSIEGEQASVSLHLSVLVESTDEGCRATVFYNGVYANSFLFKQGVTNVTQNTTVNVTENSAIVLWAQDTALTIDNLKLLTIKN
ncbi:MAG TPA: hypothetical protein DDW30_02285 [Clostridiales bacterium]|nr:hypothetical protein [Clostridiales bacterium]